jgi:hypothetical protein
VAALPFCCDFRPRRNIGEVDGNLTFSDGYALDDVLHDLALLFGKEVRPPAIEVLGLADDVVPG